MRTTIKKTISVLLSLIITLSVFAGTGALTRAQAYDVGDTIEFGTYPQTEVTDSELIAALDAADKAWASYGYYSGSDMFSGSTDGQMQSGDWMEFADLFYGGKKYRAVRFSGYRPNMTGFVTDGFFSYQDDNAYYTGTTYYFKYQPLTWRVLDPDEGLIMCDSIADSQAYQNTICFDADDYEYYQASGSSVYANDYATSSIRAWLNYDFYETAFTAAQKEKIKTTALDNYAADPAYDSAATNDKIFLLAYDDALYPFYGFGSVDDRKAQGTDYARCQGLFVNGDSYWWLRSPGGSNGDAFCVSDDGEVDKIRVTDTSNGVRPVCVLSTLADDATVSDSLFSYPKVGDKIQFGSYPQSEVTDAELKAALEAADKIWASYGYYTGNNDYDGLMQPGDWMEFADFFCGGGKYRAVRFSQYRWDSTVTKPGQSLYFVHQDDNGYLVDTTYYFKYEPLSWRVLDPATGLVLCESLVDSQAYQNTIYEDGGESYQAIGSSVYANDYATSSIRDWLNYDFYETAFTAAQKEKISLTSLDNSATDPTYDSAGTNDKIFLLSYADKQNGNYGFSANGDREVRGTDYAKCQGLQVDGDGIPFGYWLRTPGNRSDGAYAVECFASGRSYDVDSNFIGVRPACRLTTLAGDADVSDTLYSCAKAGHVYADTGDARFTCTVCGHVDDARQTAAELADYKAAAKQALADYKNEDDYRADEKTALNAAVAAGQAEIDAAADTAAVDAALAAAENTIDAIKTDAQLTAEELAAAKETAKRELANYKNADDYRDDEKIALAAAVAAGQVEIDAATDIAVVDAALTAAEDTIDTIKTDAQLTAEEAAAALAAAKETAKTALANYKNADDYRPDEQSALAAAIAAGQARIDAATDIDAVNVVLAQYLAAIAAIRTDAQLTAEEAAAQAAADQAAADAVIAKIDAIGEVVYSDESKSKIDAARAAYDALTDAQKALVTNAAVLTAAEESYAGLKAAAETPVEPSVCPICGKTHTGGFFDCLYGLLHDFVHMFLIAFKHVRILLECDLIRNA